MSKVINCCILGDSKVGKTCLVDSYTSNSFPREYTATILDVYSALVNVGDDAITLRIFDLSGSKENLSFRKEIIKNCDVSILCYSMISQESLTSIEDFWVKELRENSPDIPIVLVGTHSDLAYYKDRGFEPIEFKAKNLSKKLNLNACLECSSLTQQDLKNVFDQAICLCSNPTEDKESLNKNKCIIN